MLELARKTEAKKSPETSLSLSYKPEKIKKSLPYTHVGFHVSRKAICPCDGGCPRCLPIQKKLRIGEPDDEYEKEADKVAEQVMRIPDPVLQPKRNCPLGKDTSCKEDEEDETKDKMLMKKEAQAHGPVRNFDVPPIVHEVLQSPGQPLDIDTRKFFEPRFGYDFSAVRVHNDAKADESARNVNALAYTVGQDVVFGAGSVTDRKLLAHELAHTIQQNTNVTKNKNSIELKSHFGKIISQTISGLHDVDKTYEQEEIYLKYSSDSIQRQQSINQIVKVPLDPKNTAAWTFLEGGNIKKSFPEEFEAILSAATGESLKIQQQMEQSGTPTTDEEYEIFKHRLRILIRLNALGLMASHRATIEGKRDKILLSFKSTSPVIKSSQKGDDENEPIQSRQEIINDIREAAKQVSFLSNLKDELESYRTTFDILEGGVLIQARTPDRLESWFEHMHNATIPYCSQEIVDYFNERVTTLGNQKDMDLVAAALSIMAMKLKNWRQQQIDGVNVALYLLHEKFPFFATLSVDDVVKSQDYFTDQSLSRGIQDAFNKLIENIDKAILKIGSESIDPFDLPEAVRFTKQSLPQNLGKPVDKLVSKHEIHKFWTSMGFTLLQTILAFIPVIGPFLAAGAGAISIGRDVDDALDRYTLAEASNQQEKSMLGVVKPGTFEWTMLAVQVAMTFADIRSGWKEMKEWQPKIRQESETPVKIKDPAGKTVSESLSPAPKEKTPDIKPKDHAVGLPKRSVKFTKNAVLIEKADASTLEAVARIKPIEGYYDVIVHGSSDAFHVLHNGEWVDINHKDLVRFMKSKGYSGGKVRLLSCETGSEGAKIAQNFSNKLGETVIAPSDKVWVHSDGTVSIGKAGNVESGHWNTFSPGGKETQTSIASEVKAEAKGMAAGEKALISEGKKPPISESLPLEPRREPPPMTNQEFTPPVAELPKVQLTIEQLKMRKVAEKLIGTFKKASKKIITLPNGTKKITGYHADTSHNMSDSIVRGIMNEPERIYLTQNGETFIFHKGGDVAIVDAQRSSRGNIITAYGSSGIKGDSGASVLSGLPSDPGEAVTQKMIVDGKIPKPDGTFFPPATSIWP